MQRYFIHLAYDGTPFHGWQVQENAHTLQAEMESALSTILKTNTDVVGCGRTDTGVHAEDFYAHFETDQSLEMERIAQQLNGILPHSMAVYKVFPVAADVHARFSATARTYRYLISLQRNPFLVNRCHFYYQSLDVEAMNQAAAIIQTYSDFSCFAKSGTEVKTNLCEISQAKWEQRENLLEFTITANRFLRNMVRAIVGTLLDVGAGKIKPEDLHEIIESKNRSNAGMSVPAAGLYLHKVSYPKEITEWQA